VAGLVLTVVPVILILRFGPKAATAG
jgi:hypothetical protein